LDLSEERGPRVKELAIVGALLALVAAAVYGPHAGAGGFLSDDWAIRALLTFSGDQGFFGAIQTLLGAPNISQRPGYAIYLAAADSVFGAHTAYYLAWAAAMGVVLALSVYWVLRLMKLPALVAGSVSLLILLFPGADALRLWITASGHQLSVTLAVLGFGLAILAFRAEGRSRIAMHAASVVLFAASVLFYEVALAVMCASVLLYLLIAPWREAVMRWVVDLVVLVPIAIIVTSKTSFERQDAAGMIEHARAMFSDALALLTSVVLPGGVGIWLIAATALLVLGSAIAVARSLAAEDADRVELRRFLVTALAGLVVVVAGYAMYVPGIDYYTPGAYGIGNRVNNAASIGWALLLVSFAMLAVTLARRAIPGSRRYVQAIALGAVLLVALQYTGQVRADASRYQRAYATGARALATMRARVPKPPAGSLVLAFGQPIEQVAGIPVFGNTYDMTSSVQLMWNEPKIVSIPAYPDMKLDCRRRALELASARIDQRTASVPYGRAYFVNTVSGAYVVPRDRAACVRVTKTWKRSPLAAEPGGYDS